MTETSFLPLYPLALNADRRALWCLFVESKELFILMVSYLFQWHGDRRGSDHSPYNLSLSLLGPSSALKVSMASLPCRHKHSHSGYPSHWPEMNCQSRVCEVNMFYEMGLLIKHLIIMTDKT